MTENDNTPKPADHTLMCSVYGSKSGMELKIAAKGATPAEVYANWKWLIDQAISDGFQLEFPADTFMNHYGTISRRSLVDAKLDRPAAASPKTGLPKPETKPLPGKPAPQAAVAGSFNPAEAGTLLTVEAYTNTKTGKSEKRGKLAPVPGTKYGISVWPEVLADAGIDFGALEIGTEYDLDAYSRIEYANSEKGYPTKATKFIPAE